MVTTTTNSIEGQRIVKYKKVLVAQSMIGGKMGCKEGEEPKSVYDMTHEEFVTAFGEVTSSALAKVVKRAEELGANAVIVGKINIGNNVLIAPGAYVNFDVPDNSIVIGNPGLIRQSPGATLGYINNTILFDEYNVRSGDN